MNISLAVSRDMLFFSSCITLKYILKKKKKNQVFMTYTVNWSKVNSENWQLSLQSVASLVVNEGVQLKCILIFN